MDRSTFDFQNRETKVQKPSSETGLQVVREGERLARIVMGVDLASQASRMRARQTLDQFGESGISATRSRMLGKQLRSLALTDTGSSKAVADMQRLAAKVRQLGVPRSGHAPLGIVKKLFGFPEKELERLSASREEFEALVASLSGSAQALRQNDVALDGFEADIREERAQIERDIALAESFERALRDALSKARADQDMSNVVRFVENEVLFYLEQHRYGLHTLNAVNQQAAMSLAVLRETNDALVQNMRLVTVATRHALDVAAMLRRPQRPRGGAEGTVGPDAAVGMDDLHESLEELMQALDRHEAWRSESAARREDALHDLRDFGGASDDGDYA